MSGIVVGKLLSEDLISGRDVGDWEAISVDGGFRRYEFHRTDRHVYLINPETNRVGGCQCGIDEGDPLEIEVFMLGDSFAGQRYLETVYCRLCQDCERRDCRYSGAEIPEQDD